MLVNMNDVLLPAQKGGYAVGLFNTVINIILLIAVNKISKKAADVSFV